MILDERTDGEFRIYAGALEAPRGGGYIAALVVNKVTKGQPQAEETFRDDCLACGHRWASADEALSYARAKAKDVLAKERRAMAC